MSHLFLSVDLTRVSVSYQFPTLTYRYASTIIVNYSVPLVLFVTFFTYVLGCTDVGISFSFLNYDVAWNIITLSWVL